MIPARRCQPNSLARTDFHPRQPSAWRHWPRRGKPSHRPVSRVRTAAGPTRRSASRRGRGAAAIRGADRPSATPSPRTGSPDRSSAARIGRPVAASTWSCCGPPSLKWTLSRSPRASAIPTIVTLAPVRASVSATMLVERDHRAGGDGADRPAVHLAMEDERGAGQPLERPQQPDDQPEPQMELDQRPAHHSPTRAVSLIWRGRPTPRRLLPAVLQ